MEYLKDYKPINNTTKDKVVKQQWNKKKRKTKKELKQERRKNREEKKRRKYENRCPKQYNVYIKSKWWEERKNKYYQLYGKRCEICTTTKYIQLHHMLYKDYGSEKDEHLVALCRGCHEEFHTVHGWHWDLIKKTNRFIIEKREALEFPDLR